MNEYCKNRYAMLSLVTLERLTLGGIFQHCSAADNR